MKTIKGNKETNAHFEKRIAKLGPAWDGGILF